MGNLRIGVFFLPPAVISGLCDCAGDRELARHRAPCCPKSLATVFHIVLGTRAV
jgi:hypothetical protein